MAENDSITKKFNQAIELMISYVILDGERIDFIAGIPPRIRRQKSRHLTEGVLYEEYNMLDELRRRNFIYRIAPVYALIKRNIPNVNISLRMISGLARFFSIVLGIPIYREHYRRFNTTVFWMQMHYHDIILFLMQHILTIHYRNRDYMISIY